MIAMIAGTIIVSLALEMGKLGRPRTVAPKLEVPARLAIVAPKFGVPARLVPGRRASGAHQSNEICEFYSGDGGALAQHDAAPVDTRLKLVRLGPSEALRI